MLFGPPPSRSSFGFVGWSGLPNFVVGPYWLDRPPGASRVVIVVEVSANLFIPFEHLVGIDMFRSPRPGRLVPFRVEPP